MLSTNLYIAYIYSYILYIIYIACFCLSEITFNGSYIPFIWLNLIIVCALLLLTAVKSEPFFWPCQIVAVYL